MRDPRETDPTCRPATPQTSDPAGPWLWKCDDGYTFVGPALAA